MKSILSFAGCIIFTIFSYQGVSQQDIYKKVQNEKQKGLSFQTLPNVFSYATSEISNQKQFKDISAVKSVNFNSTLLKNAGKNISIKFPLVNKEAQLDLLEYTISPRLVLNDENKETANPIKGRHYRSIINGDSKSGVSD